MAWLNCINAEITEDVMELGISSLMAYDLMPKVMDESRNLVGMDVDVTSVDTSGPTNSPTNEVFVDNAEETVFFELVYNALTLL